MLSTRSTRQRWRAENGATRHPPGNTKDVRRDQDSEPDSPKGADKAGERDIWDSFREEHIDSIEQLPLYLHRNFTLMNELDRQSRASSSNLLQLLREYTEVRRGILWGNNEQIVGTSDVQGRSALQSTPLPTPRASYSPESAMSGITGSDVGRNSASADVPLYELDTCVLKAAHRLPDISLCSVNLLHASEEKVNLAQATYDSVDRHVRILDRAIKEQVSRTPSSDSHQGLHSRDWRPSGHLQLNSTSSSHTSNNVQSEAERPASLTTNDVQSPSHTPFPKRRSRARTSASDIHSLNSFTEDSVPQPSHLIKPFIRGSDIVKEPPTLNAERHITATTPTVFASGDMPIDPHEPRYCYCNQVSWGEMIACDSSDCEREWFHLNCAGLTEAPEGKTKWYCDDCKQRMASGANRRR